MIICQYCGTEDKSHMIMKHEMMGLTLCMRCTDKLLSVVNGRSVDELWKPIDAKRNGYPVFEFPTPYLLVYLKQRSELMNPVMRLDYNFRKGLDL